MADRDPRDLARRLTLVLPPAEREGFERVQVRLARLLARLWDMYAELLESHGLLAAAVQHERSAQLTEFRPGDTLHLGESFVQTDPRLILAERMNVPAWADLIGELAGAVLHAPDLARQELLTVLADLDENVLQEIAARFGDEEDTDEFPVQPGQEPG